MAGVAQQHDRPVRPARQRIALEQRPLVHAADRRPARAARPRGSRRAPGDHLLHLAARRPGLHVPVGIGHAGDEVDLVAPGVHGIDDDVPVGAPPLGAGIDREVAASARPGTTVRWATRPVNFGRSGPSRISRTRECTPSAPITPSAATRLPSAKTSSTPHARCDRGRRAFYRRRSARQARRREWRRAGRRGAAADRARRSAPRPRRRKRDRPGARPCPKRDGSRLAAETPARRSSGSSPSARSTRMALGLIWMPAPMRWNALRLLVDRHLGAAPRQQAGQRQSADAGADDGHVKPALHLSIPCRPHRTMGTWPSHVKPSAVVCSFPKICLVS